MSDLVGTAVKADDGSLSWHADISVVLGPISFELDGCVFVVDAAFPDTVVDFAVVSNDRLSSLAGLFADAEPVDVLLGVAAGETPEVAGLTLGTDLARLAIVQAVSAIHLGDLDEGVLCLDRAHAYRHVGAEDVARTQYAFAAPAVELLTERIVNDGLAGPLVPGLLDAVQASPPDAFVGDARERIMTILQETGARSELSWQHEFFLPADSLATSLGSIAVVTGQLLDLRMVPPRILRFIGPDRPDLEITASGTSVTVQAELRADALEDSAELAELFAVAADADTGAITASSPCSVDHGLVSARLQVGTDTDRLHYMLLSADTDIDVIRLDPTGVAVAQIDRFCRYAWTMHRTAGALRFGVGASSTGVDIDNSSLAAEQAELTATDAMSTAVGLVRQLARRTRRGPDREAIAGYSAAVERLAEHIEDRPMPTGALEPTLAELVELT